MFEYNLKDLISLDHQLEICIYILFHLYVSLQRSTFIMHIYFDLIH